MNERRISGGRTHDTVLISNYQTKRNIGVEHIKLLLSPPLFTYLVGNMSNGSEEIENDVQDGAVDGRQQQHQQPQRIHLPRLVAHFCRSRKEMNTNELLVVARLRLTKPVEIPPCHNPPSIHHPCASHHKSNILVTSTKFW